MNPRPDLESPAEQYDRLAVPFVRHYTPLLLTTVDRNAEVMDRLRVKAGPDCGWLRALTGTVDTVSMGVAILIKA